MYRKPATPHYSDPKLELNTQNSRPQTLNPKPALNPKPSSLNPKPQTLIPEPETPNPHPGTLNPKPSSLNPKPQTLIPVATQNFFSLTPVPPSTVRLGRACLGTRYGER